MDVVMAGGRGFGIWWFVIGEDLGGVAVGRKGDIALGIDVGT